MVGISTSTDAKKTCSIETGNIETWNRQAQQGRQLHSFLVRSTRTLKDLVWPKPRFSFRNCRPKWVFVAMILWKPKTMKQHMSQNSFNVYLPSEFQKQALRSYQIIQCKDKKKDAEGTWRSRWSAQGHTGNTGHVGNEWHQAETMHASLLRCTAGGANSCDEPKKQNKLSAYTRSGSCVKTFGPGQTRLAAAQVRTGTRAPTRCDLVALRRRSRNLSSPAPFSGCSVRAGRGCPAPRPY